MYKLDTILRNTRMHDGQLACGSPYSLVEHEDGSAAHVIIITNSKYTNTDSHSLSLSFITLYLYPLQSIVMHATHLTDVCACHKQAAAIDGASFDIK